MIMSRRRSAWSGGGSCLLMAVQMLAKEKKKKKDAGEPLPFCLGDWTGEYDMAEAGELAHASMVRAGMRLWSTSADVPEEGPNNEPAMQQTPCCDAALSVQR